jgi:hypothetical protein
MMIPPGLERLDEMARYGVVDAMTMSAPWEMGRMKKPAAP